MAWKHGLYIRIDRSLGVTPGNSNSSGPGLFLFFFFFPESLSFWNSFQMTWGSFDTVVPKVFFISKLRIF